MQSSTKKKKKKENNKILIKNLPVFGILSKQEDAADGRCCQMEMEMKMKPSESKEGQIMKKQDKDGDTFTLPPLSARIKIMKNAANWVSRKWKCGKARPGTATTLGKGPVIIRN